MKAMWSVDMSTHKFMLIASLKHLITVFLIHK